MLLFRKEGLQGLAANWNYVCNLRNRYLVHEASQWHDEWLDGSDSVAGHLSYKPSTNPDLAAV